MNIDDVPVIRLTAEDLEGDYDTKGRRRKGKKEKKGSKKDKKASRAAHEYEVDTEELMPAGAIDSDEEKRRRKKVTMERLQKIQMWTAALTLSYVDLGTTVLVGLELLASGGRQRGADIVFGLVGFSLFFQAVVARSQGDGLGISCITLMGGKTLLDTWRAARGTEGAEKALVRSIPDCIGAGLETENFPTLTVL